MTNKMTIHFLIFTNTSSPQSTDRPSHYTHKIKMTNKL